MSSGNRLRRMFLVGVLLAITACEPQSVPTGPEQHLIFKIVHGPESSGFLNEVGRRLSSAPQRLSDGSRIGLELHPVHDLTAAKKIASGEIKITAWLASSALIDLANSEVKNIGAKLAECHLIFATPLVFAVSPENARFLATNQSGFYAKNILAKTIPERSTGQLNFALSLTHPEDTVAGISSLIQLAYLSRTSLQEIKLTPELSVENLAGLRGFYGLTNSYPKNDQFAIERTLAVQSPLIGMTLTTEQQLAVFNQLQNNETQRLVALYPEEGSYWKDYNLCLSTADWVTPAHRAAFKQLVNFLGNEELQLAAKSSGFRPAVSPVQAVDPLTHSFGVDVRQPKRSLPPIDAETTKIVIRSWEKIAKPIAAMLVLDNSGSMDGEPLNAAKDLLHHFIARSSAVDRIGFITFSSEPKIESELDSDHSKLPELIDRLEAVGGSALYDALALATNRLSDLPSEKYRKILILITDGDDKNSNQSRQGVINLLQQKSMSITPLVFGLVREDTDLSDLQEIAAQSSGVFLKGDMAELIENFHTMMENLTFFSPNQPSASEPT